MDPARVPTSRTHEHKRARDVALVDARFVAEETGREEAAEPAGDHRGSAMMITFARTVGA